MNIFNKIRNFIPLFVMSLIVANTSEACTSLYSDFTLNSNVSGCYILRKDNMTFDGNGKTLSGSANESSNKVIYILAKNVTIKNLYLDCKSKPYGIYVNGKEKASLNSVEIKECYTGLYAKNTTISYQNSTQYGGVNTYSVFADATNDHMYVYLYKHWDASPGVSVASGTNLYNYYGYTALPKTGMVIYNSPWTRVESMDIWHAAGNGLYLYKIGNPIVGNSFAVNSGANDLYSYQSPINFCTSGNSCDNDFETVKITN